MTVVSISDRVLEHARSRPDAPAVDGPDFRLSYADLAKRMLACADEFASAGVRPGSFVVLALPNGPMAVIASLAAQHLGGCSIEVSHESTSAIRAIVEQTGARHLVVAGRALPRLVTELLALPSLARLWLVHDGELAAGGAAVLARHGGAHWPSLGPDADPALTDVRGAERDANARAMLVYTSGSTRSPRAVVQTVGNVLANTRSIVEYLELGASDRAALVLPLHYCYGKSVLSTHLFAGGSVFLDPRFAFPRLVLGAFEHEGITGFAGVPLTYELLRREIDPRTLSFSRLRYVTQAGGPMRAETADWVRRAFAPARLYVMYGQTEATARLSYVPPERTDKRGSIGIPIPGVELGVVDDAGAPVPPGTEGHLVARGDNVCPGYFQDPAATREILRDGWLWTGDRAVRDEDGFYFVVGRAREIMKIGGYRVSPTEIEETVAEHPDVLECGVVPIADEVSGEAAVAFVVARPGTNPTALALRKFCAERQPSHKVPKLVVLVDALPRSASGKLVRGELALSLQRNEEKVA